MTAFDTLVAQWQYGFVKAALYVTVAERFPGASIYKVRFPFSQQSYLAYFNTSYAAIAPDTPYGGP
jgi:hypothetical protein